MTGPCVTGRLSILISERPTDRCARGAEVQRYTGPPIEARDDEDCPEHDRRDDESVSHTPTLHRGLSPDNGTRFARVTLVDTD